MLGGTGTDYLNGHTESDACIDGEVIAGCEQQQPGSQRRGLSWWIMARHRRGHREAILRVAASDPDLTRAEIARRVSCSESTVNRHMGPATSAPATRADDTRAQALPPLAQHQDAPTRAKQPEKTDPPPRMGAAADRSSRLREAAAPDIAAASLLVLADDSDADVRVAEAANQSGPRTRRDDPYGLPGPRGSTFRSLHTQGWLGEQRYPPRRQSRIPAHAGTTPLQTTQPHVGAPWRVSVGTRELFGAQNHAFIVRFGGDGRYV